MSTEEFAKKRKMIITPETESLPEGFVRIELLIGQIVSEFGEGTIQRLSEQFLKDAPDAIPTGHSTLDTALGSGGGIPRGRVTEIYGSEGSGKTTLALQICAAAQERGGLAAYIDAECALSPKYVKLLGVKADDLYISQPDSGEQAIEIVEALLRSKCFDIIVVDSVAALVPREELGEAEWLISPGLHARLISRALRKLAGLAYRSRTALIFTNQLRSKTDTQHGYVETTTGGYAVPAYASLRLEMHQDGIIHDERARVKGIRVKVKVVKNKTASPGSNTQIEIPPEKGHLQSGALFQMCLERGIIERVGDWFTYQGRKIATSRHKIMNEIEINVELRNSLETELRQTGGVGKLSGERGDGAR